MLKIEVPKREIYDENTKEFSNVGGVELKLEHSLVSISKWEAKWHKPFLSTENKTTEELLDYIRCMSINPISDPKIVAALTQENIKEIVDYIQNPMSATTINQRNNGPKSREIVTSELIYYWMCTYGIPFECQKWHLNRLMKLIEICGVKNAPQKNMSRGELARSNAALNKARRARYHSRG